MRPTLGPSRRLRIARLATRTIQKPAMARARSIFWARVRTEPAARLFLRGRAPFAYRSDTVAGVPVRRRDVAAGRGTLLYVHGGGYVVLSARTHQGIAARLAAPLGLAPVLPDYRRAPEAPYPAALDDVWAVYGALEPPVVVAGESAGGGLAMALLHRCLAVGAPLPAAVLVFSPWADLTLQGASLVENADTEVLLPPGKLAEVAAAYAGGADPATPEISPVFGHFAGAPPVLIQVVADEILRSDAEALAARLMADGAHPTLEIIPHGIHAFQLMAGWLPEADAACDRAIAFARAALDKPLDRAVGEG